MFKKRIIKYYYDETTGVFQGTAYKANPLNFKNYPYVEREEFFYADYRINPETLELIYEPVARGPRG